MYVITETGLLVFEGNKAACDAYVEQAIKKGSKPGFLRVMDRLEI